MLTRSFHFRHLIQLMGVCVLSIAMLDSARAEPVRVVATFSVLGDMVKQIGGDRVALTTLVGPDGDTHVFQPSPADARAVAKAQLLVVNGLGFEGWMERLLEAANFKGALVTATDGIDAIKYVEDDANHDDGHKDAHDGGESGKHGHDDKAQAKAHKDDDNHDKHTEHEGKHAEHHDGHKEAGHDDHDHGTHDPHAWQEPASAQVYVRNIAQGLSAVDATNATYYQERLASYLKQLQALDVEIKTSLARLPANRRTVVTSHDAFQYFGRAVNLTFLAPQGISTESEASAKDVARLIRQIREQKISAVFVENLGDARLIERIAEETGAAVGGTLYPGALSPPDGPAPTYLDMLRTNARALHDALKD